jgi:Cu(I)/Ag(I) efflux system membrane protein CusA/SilA
MKPLAAPVLGGMVSSLVHVLIVTPVIFFWLRERHFGLQDQPLPDEPASARWRSNAIGALGLVVLILGALASWRIATRTGGHSPPGSAASAGVIQTVRSGDLEIVLRSDEGTLRQGRNSFLIEFREPGGGTLVDVGAVLASANMVMPGMVMSSGLQVTPTNVPGRYAATAEFGMAGAWQMAIEWDGPAGKGSVNFEGGVQ